MFIYLSNNPVNLSNFIDIFINSFSSGWAELLRDHTRSLFSSPHGKCAQMRGQTRVRSERLPTEEGLLNNPVSGAGGMEGHAASAP